ncbi:SMF protein, partial [Burkholderia sp. TJI49]
DGAATDSFGSGPTTDIARGAENADHAAAGAPPLPATAAPPALPDNPTEQAVLAALGYGPVTYEWLAEHSGLPDDDLHRALLALELAGHVAPLPGGRFARLDAVPTPPAPGVLQSPA